MPVQVYGHEGFELRVDQDLIPFVSDGSTADPHWTFTDAAGHEHRAERYHWPTLDLVIDASHECDGTEGWMRHDPHTVIDEAHYECKECREVIEPGRYPAGYRFFEPGLRHVTLIGRRADGAQVTMVLREEGEAYVTELLAEISTGVDTEGTARARLEEVLAVNPGEDSPYGWLTEIFFGNV